MINRKNFKFKEKKGFTMLEILISISVLLLAMGSLSTLLPYSLSVSNEAKDAIKATGLAQNYLEKIKSDFKYATVYDAAAAGATPPVSLTSTYTNNNYFTVTTNITDLQTQLTEGSVKVVLKEIDIKYLKTGKQLVRLTTMVSRPR